MKAYKFRGAEQIPYALDIILKRRLYCSDWRLLNDPLEGHFSYSFRVMDEYSTTPIKNTDYFDRVAEQIVDEKKRKRVCSLSLTAESKLLWAHYASGFTGLAVELDIPDDDLRVRPVVYSGAPCIDIHECSSAGLPVSQILSSKFPEWNYEQEVRIIQDEPWFKLTRPVTKVICGPRMNDAMIEALAIVCEAKDVPLSVMYVDGQGVDLDGQRNPVRKLAQIWEKIGQTKTSRLEGLLPKARIEGTH